MLKHFLRLCFIHAPYFPIRLSLNGSPLQFENVFAIKEVRGKSPLGPSRPDRSVVWIAGNGIPQVLRNGTNGPVHQFDLPNTSELKNSIGQYTKHPVCYCGIVRKEAEGPVAQVNVLQTREGCEDVSKVRELESDEGQGEGLEPVELEEIKIPRGIGSFKEPWVNVRHGDLEGTEFRGGIWKEFIPGQTMVIWNHALLTQRPLFQEVPKAEVKGLERVSIDGQDSGKVLPVDKAKVNLELSQTLLIVEKGLPGLEMGLVLEEREGQVEGPEAHWELVWTLEGWREGSEVGQTPAEWKGLNSRAHSQFLEVDLGSKGTQDLHRKLECVGAVVEEVGEAHFLVHGTT